MVGKHSPPSPSSRRGLGEYEVVAGDQSDGIQGVAYIRGEFFRTIRDIAPQVLEDLLRSTFDSFGAADMVNLSGPQRDHVWTAQIPGAVQFTQPQQRFRQGLWDWCRRWHLDADWCREWAFEQLDFWERTPEAKTDLSITPVISGGVRDVINPEAMDPPAGLPRWFPDIQTQSAYLDDITLLAKSRIEAETLLALSEPSRRVEIINSVRARAKAYCDQVEKLLAGRKSYRVTPKAPLLPTHLKWTVKARVLKMSWDVIVQEATEKRVKEIGYNSDVIKDAVRNILRTIELPLEPTFGSRGRRGKPK